MERQHPRTISRIIANQLINGVSYMESAPQRACMRHIAILGLRFPEQARNELYARMLNPVLPEFKFFHVSAAALHNELRYLQLIASSLGRYITPALPAQGAA